MPVDFDFQRGGGDRIQFPNAGTMRTLDGSSSSSSSSSSSNDDNNIIASEASTVTPAH